MRRLAGVFALLVPVAAACSAGTSNPDPSGQPDAPSVTVEVVDLSASEDAVGPLVSFRLKVGSPEQDVLVPTDAAVVGLQETAPQVAVLHVPLAVTGGGDDAPAQVVGRLVPAGESVTLEDAGAVSIAEGVSTVQVCVDVLAPVPAAAGAPDDGLVQFSVPEGSLATELVCSTDTSIEP